MTGEQNFQGIMQLCSAKLSPWVPAHLPDLLSDNAAAEQALSQSLPGLECTQVQPHSTVHGVILRRLKQVIRRCCTSNENLEQQLNYSLWMMACLALTVSFLRSSTLKSAAPVHTADSGLNPLYYVVFCRRSSTLASNMQPSSRAGPPHGT